MPDFRGNYVWSYTWHRVKEDGTVDKRIVQWWNVDLYWRGLSKRPRLELIPDEMIWRPRAGDIAVVL